MSETNRATLDFEAYSIGLGYASVCSSLSLAETTERLNLQHPTLISSPWTKADEKFKSGELNPCLCERNPSTHKHYLFVC